MTAAHSEDVHALAGDARCADSLMQLPCDIAEECNRLLLTQLHRLHSTLILMGMAHLVEP